MKNISLNKTILLLVLFAIDILMIYSAPENIPFFNLLVVFPYVGYLILIGLTPSKK